MMSEQNHKLGDQDMKENIKHTGEQDAKNIQETSLRGKD